MRTCPTCGSTTTYPAATNFMCDKGHLFPWTGEQKADAREEVAVWMIANGIVTGHGDTLDDLLKEIVGHTKAQERARCEDIVQAARFGEVDRDLRCIVSMINGGQSAEGLKAEAAR